MYALQANVSRAEADLTGTRQRLEEAALLAPFDGVISLVKVEPGEVCIGRTGGDGHHFRSVSRDGIDAWGVSHAESLAA